MLWYAVHAVVQGGGVESKTLPSILAEAFDSPIILSAVAAYSLATFALHLGVLTLWLVLWRSSLCSIGQFQTRQTDTLGVLLIIVTLLFVNAEAYPSSFFARPWSEWLGTAPGFMLDLLLKAAVVAVCLIATVRILLVTLSRRLWRWGVAAFTGLSLSALATIPPPPSFAPLSTAAARKPDVILVGIDSLRVDQLVEGEGEVRMPNLSAFLNEAAVFRDALTPLARTFPAWLSILTGVEPLGHGARFNLMAPELLRGTETLATILAGYGYQTAYATDETRFANIDRRFGFQRVIAPPMGAADFLLGEMNDLPISNLLSSTRLGAILFPHTHGNRAAAVTYRPDAFDAALRQYVTRELSPGRPLFLAVHFELAHWPYEWKDSAGESEHRSELSSQSPLAAYRRALSRVDRQVQELLLVLREAGRLDRAVVIAFSDHGESFLEDEPSWRDSRRAQAVLQPAAGHGTHVMSRAQHQVLLGMRGFGDRAVQAGPREQEASLCDIKPTVLEWLELAESVTPGETEGRSLFPVLREETKSLPPRSRFLETGFSLPGILSGKPDAGELFKQGARYYRVRADGRLVLREEWVERLLTLKQRAVVRGEWLAADIPEIGSVVVLARRKHGTFRIIECELFDDLDEEGRALVQQLCERFDGDPGFSNDLCGCRFSGSGAASAVESS